MSDFDDAFAASDTEAFKVMQETVHLSHPEAEAFEALAIVLPGGEMGFVNRPGGQSSIGALNVEISAAVVSNHGVSDGWRLRWKDMDYRITALLPQGDTFTAVCSALGGARDE